MMDLQKLLDVAIKAALSAGSFIKESMKDDHKVEAKEGGNTYASQIVTEVDKACEEKIISTLMPTCKLYDLALLSEESEDDGSRFEKDYFWCIDPMDGTLPFVNKRPGFAVSIALVRKDGVPLIGVVYDPCTDALYHAVKNGGAFKNKVLWKIQNSNTYLTYVTDKKLKDTPKSEEIKSMLNQKAAELRLDGYREMSGGGSVMNAIYVLENGPACMLKYPKSEKGGGSVWDFAATACIFHELGQRATNFEGGRLDLNRRDETFMNHEGVYFGNC